MSGVQRLWVARLVISPYNPSHERIPSSPIMLGRHRIRQAGRSRALPKSSACSEKPAARPAPLTMHRCRWWRPWSCSSRRQSGARAHLGGIDRRDGRAPALSRHANVWWMPIQTRTEMLATGIRSNLGIKVFGPDLAALQKAAVGIERALQDDPRTRPYTRSALCRTAHRGLLPRFRARSGTHRPQWTDGR